MHASMRALIILSCLAVSTLGLPTYTPYQTYGAQTGYYHGPLAPLAHDGRVVDTPEVAHAKQAHLAAHAAEAAKTSHLQHAGYQAGYQEGYHDDYHNGNYDNHHVAHQSAYHGPPAPLAHDGRVIDTPEVAHAKAAHLAAHAEEVSKIAQLSYHDPYAYSKW